MRSSHGVHGVLLWLVASSLTAHAQDSTVAADSVPPSSEAREASAAARDPDPPGYREAVDYALNELKRSHFSEARAMFLRAHEIYPNARTLRGLALAEFELRSYTDSIDHFQQSLEHPVRPLDAKLRAQAQALMQRARRFVTRLDLTITPEHAIATLDGTRLLPRQRSLMLNEGQHTLEVEADGYRPERRTIRALGGDAQRLALSLTPEPPPPTSSRDALHRPLYKNPWLWAGVGALLAGAAVTASVLVARGDDPKEPAYGGTANVTIPGL